MEAAVNTIDAVQCGLISDTLVQFGEARLRVTGSSMLPAVLPGDILVVRRQESSQLRKGDIALFLRGNRLLAHRILGKKAGAFPYLVTRGDSMPQSDPPVSAREVLGRVTMIIRGTSRIVPAPAGFLSRAISLLFRESDGLTKLLLWLLNRTRLRREGAQCRA